jgi:hypothetical protein
MQRVTERIAISTEITELPNLTAFLALAGDMPTRRIRVEPRDFPVMTNPLEE